MCTDSFNYIPYVGSSFWIKNGSSSKLWLNKWPQIVKDLPQEYDSIRDRLLNFENWAIPPFEKFMTMPAKMAGSYSFREFLKYRKDIKRFSKSVQFNLFCLCMVPPSMVRYYCVHESSLVMRLLVRIVKFCRKTLQAIVIGLRDIRHLFDGSANYKKPLKYNYIRKDYIHEVDEIKSELLVGQPDAIKNPLITVVMPVYKRYDTFKEAIQSVLDQVSVTFNWNILVIDNEPYDGQKNNIQKYLESINDTRICYYRNHKNLGAGGNMNRGVLLSTGKYVAILHDDDLFIGEFIKKIGKRIQYLENYTDGSKKPLGMITDVHMYVPMKKVFDQPESRAEFKYRDMIHCLEDDGSMVPVDRDEFLYTGGVGVGAPTAGTIYLRDAYIKEGGFSNVTNSLLDDAAFAFDIMKHYSVYRSDFTMGYYRQGNNESSISCKQIIRDLFDVRERCYGQNLYTKFIGRLIRQVYIKRDIDFINNNLGVRENIADYQDLLKWRYSYLEEKIAAYLAKCYTKKQRKKIVKCPLD